ncbi:MAG TPA: glycosyltransferase [Egibacteraceae bacterium]|nr:glycosyltransferase [Egibacteraceae bacterium]
MSERVTVVVATQNRRGGLADALERLAGLSPASPVIVVDNASTDGTAQMVRARFPGVRVVVLPRNIGAAARNAGAREAATDLVAFSDDDSWWAPGALARAAEHFDAHPRLGLLAARMLVGAREELDPVCDAMAASPLGTEPDLPGPSVLGFVACGAVVRRDAFLQAGGFHERFLVGGEEELLALDLATAGWGLAYVDDVVAHHHPSPSRNPSRRRRIQRRNALWAAWLRRPLSAVAGHTLAALGAGLRDADARAGLGEALTRGAWVLRERRVVPAGVERRVRRLERGKGA